MYSKEFTNLHFRARRKWRETVTGDPNKRIRDHMKETPQVKMLDKFSFTLGKTETYKGATRVILYS